MNKRTIQALNAIIDYRLYTPEPFKAKELDFLKKDTRLSGYRGKRKFAKNITPEQTKAIVNHFTIDKLQDIYGLGPKRIEALLDYAGIKKQYPKAFWLIHYTYFDSQIDQRKEIHVKMDIEIDINIAINRSPALWLLEYLKEYPDHLVTLKMAIPITEEEYNLF